MGLHYLSAALKLPMKSASAKAVLLALSNYANDEDGYCWPSLETLQLCTALSERTVRSALRDLEDLGLVATRRRKQATSLYHVALLSPTPADFAGLDPNKIQQDRHLSPPRPATVAPEPEDNQNNNRSRASRRGAPASPSGERQGSQDARAFSESWRPDAPLSEWFDSKFPEVDMDAQVEAFVSKNLANGTVPHNAAEAFKGFCAMIPSLRLPPKPRARPGTKAAEVEQRWETREARLAKMKADVERYRKWGKDEQADELEQQIRKMETEQ